MKLHIHIPKLLDFALYTACDIITLYGRQCLKTPIPRTLYLRTLMVFAEKHRDMMTVKKLYDGTRGGGDVLDLLEALDADRCSATVVPNVLDHVVLDDDVDTDVLGFVFACMLPYSDCNTKYIIDTIHRFAARCVASQRTSVMVMMNNAALDCCPGKAVRDTLIKYGAELQSDELYKLCSCGMFEKVKNVLERGFDRDALDRRYIKLAIESGDTDTMNLMNEQWTRAPSNILLRDVPVIISDLEIFHLEMLLSRGILNKGTHYKFVNINSIDKLRWLIEHDVIDIEYAMINAIFVAASFGGYYIDILHYMIECAHMPLARDVLVNDGLFSNIPDLSILDYLISHGADVSARSPDGESVMSRHPYLLRYWLDRTGYQQSSVLEDFVWHVFKLSNSSPITLRLLLELMNGRLNINIKDGSGMTMLHYAVYNHSQQTVLELIERGARINAINNNHKRPLHIACRIGDGEIVRILLNNHAFVNVRDGDGRTPLHIACHLCNDIIVEMLLGSGASVQIRDVNGHTPYQCIGISCRNSDIVDLMVHYGAEQLPFVETFTW